nr:MAG TPA: protein of unknown function (DUF5361) [Bacteriophage sp.]
MVLAHLLALDKDALICDLAETYHILDYKSVPVKTLAVLAAGLNEDARNKRKAAGGKAPLRILLSAAILDQLSMLVWMQSKDGQKGINRPKSLVKARIIGETEQAKSFRTADEFQEERERILAKRRR